MLAEPGFASLTSRWPSELRDLVASGVGSGGVDDFPALALTSMVHPACAVDEKSATSRSAAIRFDAVQTTPAHRD
jgi:hypothetical protein